MNKRKILAVIIGCMVSGDGEPELLFKRATPFPAFPYLLRAEDAPDGSLVESAYTGRERDELIEFRRDQENGRPLIPCADDAPVNLLDCADIDPSSAGRG